MGQKQSIRYLLSGGLLGLTTTMMFGAASGLLASPTETAQPISVTSSSSTEGTGRDRNQPATHASGATHKTARPTYPVSSPTASPSSDSTVTSFNGSNERVVSYGYLQVKIDVENGSLSGIDILDYPKRDRNSEYISQQVLPWLIDEAMKAQSADVALISGATYTSMAFRNSLQAALDEAGL
jgi:uncharacterized protein with FMN-binding domain